MERVPIDPNCIDLLTYSAGDLIPKLEADQELVHVKMQAFDYYNPKTGETYQVQVTVTRDENDFLGFMEVEEMSNYSGYGNDR